MKKKNKGEVNFLDFVPVKVESQKFMENEDGNIVMCIERKSIYDKIARLIRKKTPKFSYYTLDALGSFVWKQIDGTKDVFEIGRLVKEEFAEEAEPLYERLAKFIQILEMNRFVEYKK